jgi:calcineurin-like phosphoesterase family protein
MRWFTSDTHFGHARISELAGRPFTSVDEMNETIISRWNALVKPNDIVFHLGDVALGQISESLPLCGRLNGTKFLIPGNHDRIFPENRDSMRMKFVPEYQKYFVILPLQTMMTLGDGTVVNASHFPYSGDSHADDRYPEYRPVDDGKVLLHGHVHEKWRVRDRMINVGVDVNNFFPVSEADIIERIRWWTDV